MIEILIILIANASQEALEEDQFEILAISLIYLVCLLEVYII
jgi:hypothetical protein